MDKILKKKYKEKEIKQTIRKFGNLNFFLQIKKGNLRKPQKIVTFNKKIKKYKK